MKNKKQIILPMTIAILSIGGIALNSILETSFSKTDNNYLKQNILSNYEEDNTVSKNESNDEQNSESENNLKETPITKEDTIESNKQTNDSKKTISESNKNTNNKQINLNKVPESNNISSENKLEIENINVESISFPEQKYFATLYDKLFEKYDEVNDRYIFYTPIELNTINPVNPVFTPSNATNKSFTLSSSNEDIASITNDNKIILKECGTTTITAKSIDGNHEASYTLRVIKKARVNISIKEEIDPREYNYPKVLGIIIKVEGREFASSYTTPRFKVDIKVYKDNELIKTASLKEQTSYSDRFIYTIPDYTSGTYKVEYTVNDSVNNYTFTEEATATINKTS